ncbi:unnamed protein product, partial [Brassica oleracea]
YTLFSIEIKITFVNTRSNKVWVCALDASSLIVKSWYQEIEGGRRRMNTCQGHCIND